VSIFVEPNTVPACKFSEGDIWLIRVTIISLKNLLLLQILRPKLELFSKVVAWLIEKVAYPLIA